MSKQTAVEWLVEILLHKVQLTEIEKMYIKRAKQMEKEQMENVFKEAQECAVKADGVYFKHESFDKLYNETYGGQDD